jgi:hypothetical protein
MYVIDNEGVDHTISIIIVEHLFFLFVPRGTLFKQTIQQCLTI